MNILNKISVGKIIKSHFKTLVNNNTHKPEFDDILTFVILPICVSTFLIWRNVILDDKVTNVIITALSIFVGLLFNVVVLIFDIVNRNTATPLKREFLMQVLANICFSIFISILTIVFALFAFSGNDIVKSISSWLVYFLSTSFLVVLLMILKRIYALFSDEIQP